MLGLGWLGMLAGLASTATAQVILIDRRPDMPIGRSYEVKAVSLDARVRDQVAEVRVAQTFHNPGSTQLEAEYLFPIPEDAAIQDLVLLADGKELPGKLLSKEEARSIYEGIVRSKKDPALLEYMGRGLYRTSVFPIPPGADRQVTLRYTQLLKREGNAVELSYPFGAQKFTAKPIERLEFRARIENASEIKGLYSPSHDVEVKRQGDHEAEVTFVQRDVIPRNDFRLLMTLEDGDVGASVVSYRPSAGEDGYFLLLASPKVERPKDRKAPPKTVLFVLDRSGSMSGKKIEQAKASLAFVLQNLREDDLFNIIVYDDRVETFKPELQRYNSDSRKEALRYVENLRPGGSTNIDEALQEAMAQLKDRERPSYVLFLTDGLPTVGETNEQKIAAHAKAANDHGARLFSFGVGHDVNARLLDRLSGGNGGASEYVAPDEDIEAKVARFFAKLTSPVLAGLRIDVDDSDVNRTYPRALPDLFEGGQLVWVGRYRESGRATVTLKGRVGDETRTITAKVDLADPGEGRRHAYLPRLWATRRIGDLIDQIDLHGPNRELTDELVALSKEHGILTPYTSFLADERTDLHAGVQLRGRAEESLRRLSEAESGALGVGQRKAKQRYLYADRAQTPEALAAAPAAADPAVASAGRPLSAGQPARPGVAPSGRMMGRGLGGYGGMGAGGPAPGAVSTYAAAPVASAPAPGQLAVARDAEGREQAVGTVRQVGAKTFYLRNGTWVDSAVTPEDEKKAKAITQFSDAYFALARERSSEENQYLTFREPVVVRLADGQVFRIEPEAKPATR
jgi:Ca-activated chloride channel family protein